MNFFKRFPTSLYDLKKYNSLRKTSMLSGILYLAILSIILSLAISIRPIKISNNFQELVNKVIDNKVTALNIEDGNLIVNNKEELTQIESEGNLFFGIDTKDDATADNYIGQIGIILSKNGVVGRMNNLTDGVNESFSLKYDSYDLTNNINENVVLSILKSISTAMKIIFFIESPIVIFIEYIFLSIVFALIASIISNGLRMNLAFNERFKMAIYSTTILIIIRSITSLIGYDVPFVILAIIQVTYMGKAIKQIKLQEDNINNV